MGGEVWQRCGVRCVRLFIPLVVLSTLLGAAPMASALFEPPPHRASSDACDAHFHAKHVRPTENEDRFLMCGERIVLPAQNGLGYKFQLEPPTCQHDGTVVAGSTPGDFRHQTLFARFHPNAWKWHYVVEHDDEDVVWNGSVTPVVRHDRLVGVIPEIVNQTAHPLEVRVFFECTLPR